MYDVRFLNKRHKTGIALFRLIFNFVEVQIMVHVYYDYDTFFIEFEYVWYSGK